MSLYSFSVEFASEYGVDEAILIQNLQFWIKKNAADGRHNHEGRYWTYCSAASLKLLFPFWHKKKIQRLIKSLVDREVLLKGNFNKVKFDRTGWYSFRDQVRFIGKQFAENPIGHNWDADERQSSLQAGHIGPSRRDTSVQPIPDSNTDIKQIGFLEKTKFRSAEKRNTGESENDDCQIDWRAELNPNNQVECRWSPDKLKLEVSGEFEKELLQMAGNDSETLSNWLTQAAGYVGENLTGLALKRSILSQVSQKAQRKRELDRKYPGKQESQPHKLQPEDKELQKRKRIREQMAALGFYSEDEYRDYSRRFWEMVDSGIAESKAKQYALDGLSLKDAQKAEERQEEVPAPKTPEEATEAPDGQIYPHSGDLMTISTPATRKRDAINAKKQRQKLAAEWEKEAQEANQLPIVNGSGDRSYLLNSKFMSEG